MYDEERIPFDWFLGKPEMLRNVAAFFSVPLPEKLELGPDLARAMDALDKRVDAYFLYAGVQNQDFEEWPAWNEQWLQQ